MNKCDYKMTNNKNNKINKTNNDIDQNAIKTNKTQKMIRKMT